MSSQIVDLDPSLLGITRLSKKNGDMADDADRLAMQRGADLVTGFSFLVFEVDELHLDELVMIELGVELGQESIAQTAMADMHRWLQGVREATQSLSL